MFRYRIGVLALLCTLCARLGAQEPQSGWIEGTVTTPAGKPVWQNANWANTHKLRVIGPSRIETTPDAQTGGHYSITENLKPGVYDVFVMESGDGSKHYRPQQVQGVVIKPGVRTILNIVVTEGDALEVVGQSATPLVKAMVLADEIARLAKEVEALKKQLASLAK